MPVGPDRVRRSDAGLAMIGYGVAIIAERGGAGRATPAGLPVTMAALGTWGVVLMPKSPFGVFGPLAALAGVRRRSAMRAVTAR